MILNCNVAAIEEVETLLKIVIKRAVHLLRKKTVSNTLGIPYLPEFIKFFVGGFL